MFLFIAISCDTAVYNGDYCADVTYYNPNTGRHSEYELIINVSNNKLEKIDFPQGWLDTVEFGDVKLNNKGYASFHIDRKYEYTVRIKGKAENCFNDVAKAKRCKGITKSGTRCRKLTDNKSGYCNQHKDQE